MVAHQINGSVSISIVPLFQVRPYGIIAKNVGNVWKRFEKIFPKQRAMHTSHGKGHSEQIVREEWVNTLQNG